MSQRNLSNVRYADKAGCVCARSVAFVLCRILYCIHLLLACAYMLVLLAFHIYVHVLVHGLLPYANHKCSSDDIFVLVTDFMRCCVGITVGFISVRIHIYNAHGNRENSV